MPTYEYTCKTCGEHLEVVQSFKDDPLTACPSCGGTLRKVFGNIGIAFKGSGFYRNDSRSDGGRRHKTDAKSDTKAETKETSSGTGSTTSSGSDAKSSGGGSDAKTAPASSSAKGQGSQAVKAAS